MESPEIIASPAGDYRTGLILFGALDILAAIVFLIRAIAFAAVGLSGANLQPIPLLPGELPVLSLVALLPAVFFMALGIGSILGRRWARSLSLAFASLWLAVAAFTAACVLFVLPAMTRIDGQRRPFLFSVALVLFAVVPPGAYVLFYRSRAVKAQCEWLDPVERWTDRLPGIALAALILLVVEAGIDLRLGFSASRQILFFGEILRPAFRMALLAAGAIQVAFALGLSRRMHWAWIGAVAVMAAHLVGDVLIARNITIDRLSRLAVSVGKAGERDRAALRTLGALNWSAVITTWVAVIGVAALAIVILAGRRSGSPKKAN